MEESKAYKKEGTWANVSGFALIEKLGKKKAAAYVESQEAMIMQCVKLLGGKVVLPHMNSLQDVNLEMKVSQMEDDSCEIMVREKMLAN